MGSQIELSKQSSRARLRNAAVLAAGALAVTLVVAAVADARFGRHHGHGRGPWSGDPAEAREHAQFVAEWVLRKVDATQEQKDQVSAAVGKLVEDVAPLAERHRDNRAAWATAFSQETVDRATLDGLRASELELAAAASTALVDALAQVGAVLDAEQRRELVAALERRHRHRRWH